MEKIKRTLKSHISQKEKSFSGIVLTAVLAFAASFGKILGFPAAMNVALAAVSGANAPAAFVGSLFAYIITGNLENGIVQLCSILTVAALQLINPFGSRYNEPLQLSLVTTGSLMLFGCVMSAAMPADAYTVSLRMISALMCGCVVFIAKTIAVSKNRSGVYDLTGINGIFIGVIYIMIISTLAAVPLPVVNLGRTLGTAALLLAARKYKNAGGAVVGALTACGVLLCVPGLAKNTLVMAVAGLVCGAFVQFGSLMTVLSFLAVSLVSLVAVGVNGDTYHMFADLAIGSLIFVAIPMPAVKRLAKKAVGVKNSLDIVGQTTSSKLSFAAHTLGGIREQLSLVTAAMDKQFRKRTAAGDVRNCVCSDCAMCSICFGKSGNAADGFERLEKIINASGTVSGDDVEICLPGCINQRIVQSSFCKSYGEILSEKAEALRLREMREFLTQQLSSMEDMLCDLSFRTAQVRSIDSSLTMRVREYFSHLGFGNIKVCVYVDENLCQRVDAYLTGEFKVDLVKITAELSSIIDCDLDLPVIVREDNLTRVSFSEIPKFSVQTEVFTASASGEYSGDSYDMFNLNGCEKYVLLSDGMGTGKRARLDSMFTVSLLSRLIRSGMAMTTAHKLINSMLRVKGWEESFATLDLLRIDLNGGSAELLKAGAVQSWLCRDGCIKAIGGQAFPAGILDECPPDINSIKLFDGDMILMTSDGADEETAENLARFAAKNPNVPVAETVRKMGEMVLEDRRENSDDVTIILVKVNNSQET